MNDARICLGPSMSTKKQPTKAGRSTRASLNAGPIRARTNPSRVTRHPTFSGSASHAACQPGGDENCCKQNLFCDCLALALQTTRKNETDSWVNKHRDLFIYPQRSRLMLASDWITVVPSSGRIASRRRERFAISAAPPRQPRRGGGAQVTVGRDCASACTRANPAYQTAAYRTAPVPVTDDPLATRPHAPPRPLG